MGKVLYTKRENSRPLTTLPLGFQADKCKVVKWGKTVADIDSNYPGGAIDYNHDGYKIPRRTSKLSRQSL